MHSHGSWDRRSRFLRYLRRLKRGRGIIACVPSFNFTVVTDLRSSERISFVHLARGRVSWVPNHRKVLTHPHAVISGFRKSGFRDLRVQGNSPLGIPGIEMPKCWSLRGPFSLVQDFQDLNYNILLWVLRQFTPGFEDQTRRSSRR
jgi:hypothetical protein